MFKINLFSVYHISAESREAPVCKELLPSETELLEPLINMLFLETVPFILSINTNTLRGSAPLF